MYEMLKDFAGPFATVTASLCAVFVTAHFAKRQADVASEKLRFDLFDRRLKIFESIFDSYNAMISWTGTPEQTKAREHFFRSYQESAFLFDKQSGIEETMKDLNAKGAKAIGLKEIMKDLQGDPQTMIKYRAEMTEIHTMGFEAGLERLKIAIAPYLNFHDFKSASQKRVGQITEA